MLARKLLVVASLLLFVLYGAALYFFDLSYSTYAIVHFGSAFVLVFFLSKMVKAQESSIMFGFKLSLIVGVLLLVANIVLVRFGEQFPEIPFLSSVPNPVIYFIVFMVIFNIPFLLFNSVSFGRTLVYSAVVVVLLLALPLIYGAVKLDCLSMSCSLEGCYCQYTNPSPCNCGEVCTAEGKEVVEVQNAVTLLPDIQGLLQKEECTCHCQ